MSHVIAHRALLALSLAAVLTVSATIAKADPRPFTYTYDTYSVGKGGFEYEQWATWKTHKEDDHRFGTLEFRHEFEFGLADNFDLAVYLPNWRYEDSKERRGTRFDSVGVEAIYYVMNPVKDPIGLGLYTELNVGEESVEFEYKLLLQKDIGQWIFAYNLVLETEIEGIFKSKLENEITGELKHVFGVSYALTPTLLVGGEALIESEYADWSRFEQAQFFAGPAVSWQGHKHFWITATALFQLSSEASEPDFQLRLIAGWQF